MDQHPTHAPKPGATTPDQPATDKQPVYDNRSLFSDYYLKERLSDHPEWSEDIAPAFEKARRLYRDKRVVLDGLNEAQTEDEFVRPLLRDVLGFEFEVQTAVSRQGRLNRPGNCIYYVKSGSKEAQLTR